jgi:hypothetical protein
LTVYCVGVGSWNAYHCQISCGTMQAGQGQQFTTIEVVDTKMPDKTL